MFLAVVFLWWFLVFFPSADGSASVLSPTVCAPWVHFVFPNVNFWVSFSWAAQFSHGGFTTGGQLSNDLLVCIDCFGLPKGISAHYGADCVIKPHSMGGKQNWTPLVFFVFFFLSSKQKELSTVKEKGCVTCNESVRLDVVLALTLAFVSS